MVADIITTLRGVEGQYKHFRLQSNFQTSSYNEDNFKYYLNLIYDKHTLSGRQYIDSRSFTWAT